MLSTSPAARSWVRRMADARRRARLTPLEAAASLAITEATVGGLLDNARPFKQNGRRFWRVEHVVAPEDVEAVVSFLDALAARRENPTPLAA